MQVLLLQPPAPEGTGTLFELSVNGKRFFAKGANVIPLSTFEAAINRTLVNSPTTYMYYTVNSLHIHRYRHERIYTTLNNHNVNHARVRLVE